MGFFDRIKSGLTKTRKAMASSLGSVFSFSEISFITDRGTIFRRNMLRKR